MIKEKTEKQELSDEQRENRIITFTLIVLGIISAISVIFDAQIFGPESIFIDDPTGNSFIDGIYHDIPSIIRTCQILFLTLLLFVILSILGKKITTETHFQTAIRLVVSFVRYAIFIVAIILILSAWGVDTRTLLVSAGILGLIIGLGAQSLIADIIAGLFIVFDGEYKVGDFIVVDGWRGTVMEIGIRTTKIKDEGGNIKYMNNSTINAVVNQSQDLSYIRCELPIFYTADLESVELAIKEYMPRIKDKIPYIVNGPYYKGVQDMNDSSVNLLFLAQCEEKDFYPARRALNREIYRMANEMGIQIPYPQIVINQAAPDNGFSEKSTAKQKREATAYVYDQAYESEGMEAENSN
ncbi:small-conductance mechanosensitive channel [methanogenic archaeon mixed culture ISO4-G1]|nr:small-conductance mechanosensitive channel [methanogenic archaeon mixed culture ISO4-G1]